MKTSKKKNKKKQKKTKTQTQTKQNKTIYNDSSRFSRYLGMNIDRVLKCLGHRVSTDFSKLKQIIFPSTRLSFNCGVLTQSRPRL